MVHGREDPVVRPPLPLFPLWVDMEVVLRIKAAEGA